MDQARWAASLEEGGRAVPAWEEPAGGGAARGLVPRAAGAPGPEERGTPG